MGYHTFFELSHDGDSQAVAKAFENLGRLDVYRSLNQDAMKWYSFWDGDMIAISRALPNVEFVVKGTGEEQGDVWRCIFKNGQCQMQSDHDFQRWLELRVNMAELRKEWIASLPWKTSMD